MGTAIGYFIGRVERMDTFAVTYFIFAEDHEGHVTRIDFGPYPTLVEAQDALATLPKA